MPKRFEMEYMGVFPQPVPRCFGTRFAATDACVPCPEYRECSRRFQDDAQRRERERTQDGWYGATATSTRTPAMPELWRKIEAERLAREAAQIASQSLPSYYKAGEVPKENNSVIGASLGVPTYVAQEVDFAPERHAVVQRPSLSPLERLAAALNFKVNGYTSWEEVSKTAEMEIQILRGELHRSRESAANWQKRAESETRRANMSADHAGSVEHEATARMHDTNAAIAALHLENNRLREQLRKVTGK